MNLSFLKRDIPRRALLVVLTLAAVAGVVTGREKPATELVEERVHRQVEPAVEIDLAKLERPQVGLPQNDPFAPRNFGAEPKATHAAAGDTRPAVPPLPFQYIGKVIENGKQEVYVMRGDELLTLARGQKIGAEYRVDKITGTSITFTYLPSKTRQTLDLPALN
ncbi:MAG TPA: hypothetical protein VHG88_13200 [Burkholderiales bacterium]|nr:hypothetical protein [Burkholderiales bacterium]